MRRLDDVDARGLCSSHRPLVLAVGHFPPPVHGMAVATARFTALLAERADVRCVVISGAGRSGLTYHLTRIARTARAIVRMASDRLRSRSLYAGSDAGLGMGYTLAIVLASRALRYRFFLHHHSAAYVTNESAVMSLIVRLGGRRCTHLLNCASQARAFDARYRPACPSMVVPISFAVAPVDASEDKSAQRVLRPKMTLVLGHLSNLSVEKGLERAFQTMDALAAAGVDSQLVLAGPAATPSDEVLLDRLLASHPQARYMGPLDAIAKQRFFAEIDVFLFPTRYRHETSPVVVVEAVGAGVPVIAYGVGCLDHDFVGGAGLVLAPAENYVDRAAQQLVRWSEHPEELETCAARARDRGVMARDEGVAGATAVIELLAGRPDPVHA